MEHINAQISDNIFKDINNTNNMGPIMICCEGCYLKMKAMIKQTYFNKSILKLWTLNKETLFRKPQAYSKNQFPYLKKNYAFN